MTPALDDELLAGLDPEQREAAVALLGPVCILAGAGTGKTRALTYRIAHGLRTGTYSPGSVLALTFTTKAAAELRERLRQLGAEGAVARTFHSAALAQLGQFWPDVVGGPSPKLVENKSRLIADAGDALHLRLGGGTLRDLAGEIEWRKTSELSLDGYAAAVARQQRPLPGGLDVGTVVDIQTRYEQLKDDRRRLDFEDVLLATAGMLDSEPRVLAAVRAQYRFFTVDEYQDTNVAQYLWLRLLAQGTPDVCCVGDDDQSIYGWRGAEVGNILRFEKDFPNATIVRLERNYRSTPHILAAASHLISHNEGRLGKTLWTELKEGERISLRGVWDGDEEARQVGEEIEALQRDKHLLSQIAILVRAGFQTREFEERFITMGLPYRVIGGPRFYERLEIRDALAYCRVTVQPDDDLAFERIYNTPRRGLGESALRTLRIIQRANKVSLYEATRRALETDELKGRQRKSLGDLIQSFDRWRKMLDGIHHVEVVETILDESGYTDMLRADRSPEAEGRLENLKELTNALQEFDTLPAFLEHVALLTDNAEKSGGDMVSVMTLHAAKGLEFDTVFLPGWEEGLFPNQRALDEKGVPGLEEERRLAYVGLTRARKRAYVSFAANRRVFNQWQAAIPSRFLRELPTDRLAESSDAGLYATYSAGHHGGLRDQASGFDYESLGVTGMGRARTRWRDETMDDRRAVEGDKPDLAIGQRVFHQKFGYGRVVAIDGNKLDIEFEKAGPKKVLDSFIEAT